MKIEDIKKGMLVQFSKQIIFELKYRPPSRVIIEVTHLSPLMGMVMGISPKVTGFWHMGDQEAQGYISSIKTHKVVVIQIHSDHQRYYAPVYVRPEDCERIG